MEIISIQNAATAEADRLLKNAQNLIDDVKEVLKAGSDTLTQGQVEEWLLVIPVMVSELYPIKEAYELARKLHTIDASQIEADAYLKSDDKGETRKARIELLTVNKEVDKAVMYYIRDRAGAMVESLQSLLMSLMKIHNSKMSAPKES